MGRVRHAGYLFKKEKDFYKKHWCVVRDGSFIVYPCQQKPEHIRKDSDGSPIHIISVKLIDVKISIQPETAERADEFSLQLHIAESGKHLTFYTDQEMTLKKWVDELKKERSLDQITADGSLNGVLLPPDTNAEPIPLSPSPSTDPLLLLGTAKQLTSAKRMKNAEKKHKRTSLQPGKISAQLHENSRDRMSLDLEASMSSTDSRYSIDVSNGVRSCVTSPTSSSRSSSRPFQYSADESSVTSSATSSPRTSTAVDLKNSFSRPPIISPTNKKKKAGVFGSLRQYSFAKESKDPGEKSTRHSALTISDRREEKKGQKWYESIFEAPPSDKPPNAPKAGKRKSSTKRHTICDQTRLDVPAFDTNELSDWQTISSGKTTPDKTPINESKPAKQSIAPLSNLDFNLKQKKRKQPANFQLLRDKALPMERKEMISTSSSEDECERELSIESSTTYQKSSFNVRPDREKEESDDFRSRNLHTNLALTNRLGSAELNRSMPNLDKANEDSKNDSLTQSGNLGFHMLKRVSSVARKRSKTAEESKESGNSLQTNHFPLPKALQKSSTFKSKSKTPGRIEDPLLFPSPSVSILMEGFLYRRKKMTWNKYWTILSSDKVLRFYKSKPASKNSEENPKYSQPQCIVNLQNGCNVEDINQSKNSNTFWLHPTLTTSFETAKSLKTNSKDQVNSKSFEKPFQLLCKTNQEFIHWIKQFLLLDSKPPQIRRLKSVANEPNQECLSHAINFSVDREGFDSSKEVNNNCKMLNAKGSDASLTSSECINVKSVLSLGFESPNDKVKIRSRSSLDTLSDDVSDDVISSPRIEVTLCDGRQIGEENLGPTFEILADEYCKMKFIDEDDNNPLEKRSGKGNVAVQIEEASSRPETIVEKDVEVSPSFHDKPFSFEKESSFSNASDVKSEQIDSLFNEAGVNGRETNNETVEPEMLRNDVILNSEKDVLAGTESKTNNDASLCHSNENERIQTKSEAQTKVQQLNSWESNLCQSIVNVQTSSEASDDVIRCESEKKEEVLPFSLHSTNPTTSASKSSVADNVALFQKRFSESLTDDSVQVSHTENLHLPAVFERIKLFESLAHAGDKDNEIISDSENAPLPEQEKIPFSNEENNDDSANLCFPVSSASSVGSDENISDNPKFVVSNSLSERDFKSLDCEKENSWLTVPVPKLLRRASSDSNLAETSFKELSGMRRSKRSVPELSQIDFIEIFGSSKNFAADFGDVTSASNNKRRNSIESDDNSLHKDLSDEGSSGSMEQESRKNSLSNDVQSVDRSVGTEASEDLSRSGGRSGWLPKFRKSVHTSVQDVKKPSKEQILQIPASQHKSAAHRGYLEKRNRKKQWEKYWCVYQDACLYFYNSPQSDVTRDAIVLRGYDVVADVIKENREKFEFRLQREGSKTLYFTADNFQDYLLWVGSLEKESRSIRAQERKVSDDSESLHELNEPAPDATSIQQSSDGSGVPSPMMNRSFSNDRLEKEIVEMQKHKLLKELASQQEQILKEQKALDCRYGTGQLPLQPVQMRSHAHKRDVIRKYDHAREVEEAKVTKTMAFLNRRRNSAQLKLDQVAKELAPKSGKKRRDNHQHFAALEAKQAELKKKLAQVDNEIFKLQANKQNAMERIRERQNLELILVDNQDNVNDFLRRNMSVEEPPPPVVRRRPKGRSSRKNLSFITEFARASDSGSTRSSDSEGSDGEINHYKLTACDKNRFSSPPVFQNLDKDPYQESFFRSLSSDVSAGASDDNVTRSSSYDSLSKLCFLSSSYSFGESPDFSNPCSSTVLKNSSEVNPAVMAEIEEFEKFSAKKLEKLKHHK